MRPLTWAEVEAQADRIAATWQGKAGSVYGVPQGGSPVAIMVAHRLQIPLVEEPVLGRACLIVDDLVDSGRTLERYYATHFAVDAAFRKPHSPRHLAPDALTLDDWLVFPWERNQGQPTDAVVRLLEYIGEDPSREGLLDTPERVLKAWSELTGGYAIDPADVLTTTFDVPYDELVIVKDIPFVSFCEHHLLPFEGTATVAYIPTDRVVGLSKLARLVDLYARRLQVQERLTQQVRQALDDHLQPLGAGVIIKSTHTCMAYRGIKKRGQMVTSSLSGQLRNDATARAEFMALTNT